MIDSQDSQLAKDQAANIANWIDYDPLVGVESLHITGIPRYGKSNLASGLVYTCMKRGETLLMPGDRFCEWRHFISHPGFKKRKMNYKVLVPRGVAIKFIPDYIEDYVTRVDYSSLNVLEYLDLNLVVIYDQHLWPMGIRTWCWARVLDQLLSRPDQSKAVILLFHEAGIYFPEAARAANTKEANHYEAVTTFADLFVEAGKGLVRCIFLSQLETEIKHTIRDKTGWKIFKKGMPGKKQHRLIRKIAPYQARNEFISSHYGLFLADNTSFKFIENKSKWLMTPPPRLIDFDNPPPSDSDGKKAFINPYNQKNGRTYWDNRDKSGKFATVPNSQDKQEVYAK